MIRSFVAHIFCFRCLSTRKLSKTIRSLAKAKKKKKKERNIYIYIAFHDSSICLFDSQGVWMSGLGREAMLSNLLQLIMMVPLCKMSDNAQDW